MIANRRFKRFGRSGSFACVRADGHSDQKRADHLRPECSAERSVHNGRCIKQVWSVQLTSAAQSHQRSTVNIQWRHADIRKQDDSFRDWKISVIQKQQIPLEEFWNVNRKMWQKWSGFLLWFKNQINWLPADYEAANGIEYLDGSECKQWREQYERNEIAGKWPGYPGMIKAALEAAEKWNAHHRIYQRRIEFCDLTVQSVQENAWWDDAMVHTWHLSLSIRVILN